MRADLAAVLHDPARLEALHRLRLLEPDAAGTFARVGRLAAAALGVPAAGVNFVDAHHQFKPGAESVAEPAEHGFCPYVLTLGAPLFVTDARQDPRFAADPVIGKLGLVAYAGVPLYSAGQPVGTLCAVDVRPVRWSPRQRAVLSDLARLVMAELELRAQVAERREAEERLRASQRRFEFLSEASGLLSSSLEPLVVLEELTRLVVDRMADWCAIVEPDPHRNRLRRVAAVHRDPDRAAEIRRWLEAPAIDLPSGTPLGTAYLEQRVVRMHAPSPDQLAGRYAAAAGYPEMLARLGHSSLVGVPMVAAGRPVGAMAFVRGPDRPAFDDDETALAVELAARAAVALAHARRYEAEHGTAAFLQRSLLPQLADTPGLEIAAAYVPGSTTLTVGGDFYDVLDLGGGRAGLAVGDVMGHGVAAAAAMGQVRAGLRAYARLGMPPADALSALDGLVAELPDRPLVTCLYGVYDVRAGELRLASAGHLPPLLRVPGGEVVPLAAPPSPPLGTDRRTFTETRHPVPPRGVLALFSDGLVEDRGRDLDTGLLALSLALSRHAGGPLDRAGGAVLRALGRDAGPEDDVALLLARAREIG